MEHLRFQSPEELLSSLAPLGLKLDGRLPKRFAPREVKRPLDRFLRRVAATGRMGTLARQVVVLEDGLLLCPLQDLPARPGELLLAVGDKAGAVPFEDLPHVPLAFRPDASDLALLEEGLRADSPLLPPAMVRNLAGVLNSRWNPSYMEHLRELTGMLPQGIPRLTRSGLHRTIRRGRWAWEVRRVGNGEWLLARRNNRRIVLHFWASPHSLWLHQVFEIHLSGCTTGEVFPEWAGDPFQSFSRWLDKAVTDDAFLQRLSRRPVRAQFLCLIPDHLGGKSMSFAIGFGKEGLTLQGVPIPRERIAFFLRCLWENSLTIHFLRSAASLPDEDFLLLLRFQHGITLQLNDVTLGLGVGHGGGFHFRLGDARYPTSRERLEALMGVECRRLSGLTGLGLLREAGVPIADLAHAAAAVIRNRAAPQRRGMKLLRELARKHPKRMKLTIRGKRIDVLVKGKLRNYQVRARGGKVGVYTHPEGSHICILEGSHLEEGAAGIASDKVISRVMALLDDRHARERISTLQAAAGMRHEGRLYDYHTILDHLERQLARTPAGASRRRTQRQMVEWQTALERATGMMGEPLNRPLRTYRRTMA